MIFLYQIGIRIYWSAAVVYSLFNEKAKLFVKGRRGVFHKIESTLLLNAESQVVWFHCASLGEFEQARPLIDKVKVDSKDAKVLITFFSPSGYEIRKDYPGADLVTYLPMDTKDNVCRFLDLARPAQVYFVKYDLWYNYLNELQNRKTPTYLVSANFRADQFDVFYGGYLKKILPFFTKIFVQNEYSQKLLKEKNIDKVIVSGDMRYDRVLESVLKPKKISTVEYFKGASKVLIAGSSWEIDEQILAQSILINQKIKLIIAPHKIDETHIQKIILLFPETLLYSLISKEPVTTALDKLEAAQVLIIDNIGMLSNLYQYGDMALIGGGFGAGIHNILEAVAFGVPVVFGPNHQKFPEAAELVEQGGGFCISNKEDFQKAIGLLLSDEKILQMASMSCKNFVQGRKGATEKILKAVSTN